MRVGVRELKNHLSDYLRLVKSDHEVIVTDRGKPVAVIHSLDKMESVDTLDARLASLAAKGMITLPTRPRVAKIRRVKVGGTPLSVQILNDRR